VYVPYRAYVIECNINSLGQSTSCAGMVLREGQVSATSRQAGNPVYPAPRGGEMCVRDSLESVPTTSCRS
jgi:hypothetical protein